MIPPSSRKFWRQARFCGIALKRAPTTLLSSTRRDRTLMTDWFLEADTPLHLEHAVAAIIVVDGRGYLLQQRDNIPQIFFPDHWGLFGGAIDSGETPEAAIRRELREELMLDVANMTHFGAISFNVASVGRGDI